MSNNEQVQGDTEEHHSDSEVDVNELAEENEDMENQLLDERDKSARYKEAMNEERALREEAEEELERTQNVLREKEEELKLANRQIADLRAQLAVWRWLSEVESARPRTVARSVVLTERALLEAAAAVITVVPIAATPGISHAIVPILANERVEDSK